MPIAARRNDGSDDGSVVHLSTVFDKIGNLSNRSDTYGGSEQFCYDALNRLTKYSLNGATCHAGGTLKTVSYDDIGNITLKSDLADTNGGTGAYTYNLPGHTTPHAVQSILGTVNGVRDPSYRYDADGNLTCEYTGTNCSHGAITKETDAYWSFNMTHTIGDGATSLTLTYDSEHARITQLLTTASTTVTTNYLNDPVSGAIAEKVVSGSTNTWNDYLMADGKLVGERICTAPTPSCPATSASWQYFILDHLGSVSVVTGGTTKLVTSRESFDAWGKQRNSDWTDDATCSSGLTSPTTRGFTSQEDIAALCLVNLNARLYDPSIGRFLSADSIIPDPTDGQSYNRYTYVDNRPLSLTDPTGHDDDCSSSVCPQPPNHWNGNNNGGRPDRDAHPEMEEFGNFLIQETHTLGGDVKVTISYNVTGEAMQTPDPTKTEIGMSGNQGASQSQSDSSSNPLVTQQTLSASYVAGRTLETASEEINPATGQVVATADSEDTLPGHYVVSSGRKLPGAGSKAIPASLIGFTNRIRDPMPPSENGYMLSTREIPRTCSGFKLTRTSRMA